ncbi:uncharacterized protein si:ch211-196f5.2 [Carcharodon carcharias]|uniref:uncharacterized protein si:ch211-196f5.2 n=1 Tax=Carcharodon carcharias TaxID=13397 RepID=UPI001B7F378D|nr:uncharacterized protein si:ch211-196f5.2 [Carcharodon carcharias]XP_041036847.1 uncharacterized protein si:ch211-196f5.2 [Carcharodon carcharias]
MMAAQRADLQLPAAPWPLALPVQALEGGDPDPALEGLGVWPEEEVRERLVRLESQRTRVRTPRGRLKERLCWSAEVRLRVGDPRAGGGREIRYGSEGRPDSGFFRTRVELRPWTSGTQVDRPQGADDAVVEEVEPAAAETLVDAETEPQPKWRETEQQQGV